MEQFGIQNLLYFFLAESVVMIFGSLIARFLVQSIKLQQYLLITVLLPLVFLCIAFFFHPDQLEFFLFLVLAKDLGFYQLSIALYRKDESLFTPAEAQKMVPFVESAITVGAVVGAGITVWAMGIFPVQEVLSIWGGILLLMGGIVYLSPKWLHTIPELSFSSEESSWGKSYFGRIVDDLKKIPFLRYMALVLVLQGVIFTVVEFAFINDVQEHITHNKITVELPVSLEASLFDDAKVKVKEISHQAEKVIKDIVSGEVIMHEKLAHDLGMFHLMFGLLALFVQLFITPLVLRRFGVIFSMVGFFGILVVSLFGATMGYLNVNLLRALQHGFHSLGESSYHVSFYSWFSYRRSSMRLFLDGVVRPFGVILGVLFLFLLDIYQIFCWLVLVVEGGLGLEFCFVEVGSGLWGCRDTSVEGGKAVFLCIKISGVSCSVMVYNILGNILRMFQFTHLLIFFRFPFKIFFALIPKFLL